MCSVVSVLDLTVQEPPLPWPCSTWTSLYRNLPSPLHVQLGPHCTGTSPGLGPTPLCTGTPSSTSPPDKQVQTCILWSTCGWQAGGWHPTGILSCYRPQHSCSKVMFSQVSVILSTGDGVSGRHPPGQTPTPQGRSPRADTPLPQQTATVADGAHPTGMHSCYK